MKKKMIIIIAIIVIVLAVISYIYFGALAPKKLSFELNISEKVWSQGGKSDGSVRKFGVKKNSIITFDGSWAEAFIFEIVNVSKDSVTIKTNEAMSLRKGEKGGVNLSSEENIFIIKKSEPIILDTLTMDAGASYKIELI